MTFPACLLAGWTSVCEVAPVTLDQETLLELAHCITLEEPEITSFLVEGAVDCGNV
jgi:hypothetical protein